MTTRSFKYAAAALCVASLPICEAGSLSSLSSLLKRDPPSAIPSCATETDAKWQPGMDFDTDSCYNEPAVGPDGTLNPGLDNCYTSNTADCRDIYDLDNNNVYSRARCNNGWCGIMYGYYWPKDVALQEVCGVGAGHRHDWEHVVVWVQNDVAQYVAASAHGEYDCKPASEVRWDGSHPKVVYNKDGASTHYIRFANEDDDNIENDKGVWFYGGLMSWLGFPDDSIRDTMVNNDWGSAVIDFDDARIQETLEAAKGGQDIGLDTSYDDDTSPGEPGC